MEIKKKMVHNHMVGLGIFKMDGFFSPKKVGYHTYILSCYYDAFPYHNAKHLKKHIDLRISLILLNYIHPHTYAFIFPLK